MKGFKKTAFLLAFLVSAVFCQAQPFKFAFVSDTHIGGATASEDLRRTVQDINSNSSLEFTVITGDITEFGSDQELKLAKQILDSLSNPWYLVPGNHDSNWSESGSNSFRKIFGAETFSFTHKGYLFAGTSSGPNMRMGPGQVPRENIVWLDSVLNNMPDPKMPLIYLNHYPQDSAQNNWFDAIDRLKMKNVQMILCGHGHNNRRLDFDGIPAVMGRSNLRAKDSIGGYNIVSFNSDSAVFELRRPVAQTQKRWLAVRLKDHHFSDDTSRYFRPDFTVNNKYTNVKEVWRFQDKSDVGAGTAIAGKLIFATNTSGHVYAMDKETGKQKWLFATGGKIYSTPAVAKGRLVVGSSDNFIYCLSAVTGKLVWKVPAQKPVLGSPSIEGNRVLIGASDGHFRALDLKTGKLLWDFDKVSGFVVTKPLVYQGKVFFGSWNNEFYALDIASGKLIWEWSNGSTNRMFSAAACYPVGANGKIFIVAPDRYMTALDASSGKLAWRKQMQGFRVRESMGLSKDGSLVFVKTMDGQVQGVSTTADTMQMAWRSELQLPYELSPSALVENDGVVYVPSHSGLASAIDRKTGKVLWKYKISNSLLNPLMPAGKNRVIVSSMDGTITCLSYE
ncbi:PQQ-binding-like beta-propeller repeat protein [Flavihumibacter sp. R14]|nr:PQQ-binding-like beta-propeller repeat protein [Flavihumibacter soli]